MDTESVIEALASISIGTVISWAAVFIMVATAISTFAIKVYKLFDKYRDKKDEAERYKAELNQFKGQLNDLAQTIRIITDDLERRKESDLKQLRFSIVQTCETALHNKEITIAQLQLIEELYDDYDHVWHKNGYVKTVVNKARKLPVVEDQD